MSYLGQELEPNCLKIILFQIGWKEQNDEPLTLVEYVWLMLLNFWQSAGGAVYRWQQCISVATWSAHWWINIVTRSSFNTGVVSSRQSISAAHLTALRQIDGSRHYSRDYTLGSRQYRHSHSDVTTGSSNLKRRVRAKNTRVWKVTQRTQLRTVFRYCRSRSRLASG